MNGMADLHSDSALDRGAEWASTKTSAVSLRFSWTNRARLVRPKVWIPAINRGIVSVSISPSWGRTDRRGTQRVAYD